MSDEELNKIIMQSEDNYERLKDKLHDQYIEIERLNKDFITLKALQQKHLEEIERLNNIINELEDYIIEHSFGSHLHNGTIINAGELLDKIKELKEK